MDVIPIPTMHLFPFLEEKLIELLHSLTDDEWNKPTIARHWTVKDVAAHLLDTGIRTISSSRDGYCNKPALRVDSYEELVNYLNQLNADWVTAMKRVSPQVLTEWIASVSKDFIEALKKEDPFVPAVFSVAWSGENNSPNWFHIARAYTERWHHQQQIRDAVNKPGIITKELYYPVLDTFMMALPYTYRNMQANENAVVKISVTGESGGNWFLTKNEGWILTKENELPVTAHTSIDGNIAWKLFTKSWRKNDAMKYIVMKGDIKLAEKVLDMISVMA
jgi:uncharacterized protein (TIGR03083 family)